MMPLWWWKRCRRSSTRATACKFNGGCAGNTQGVAALVIGMTVDEAIRRLKGIQCRNGTSCPDQLATALEEYKANHAA